MQRPVSHFGYTVLSSFVFMIGGFDDQARRSLKDCFVYDVALDEWYSVASLKEYRQLPAVVNTQNWLYAAGGFNAAKEIYLNSIERV